MLNWLDFVVVAILVGAALLEVKRGFGKALFDFAALLVAVKVAPVPVNALVGGGKVAATGANEAILYVVSFLVIGGILVFIGKLLYDTTLVSAEAFDALLGGLLGIGIAITLCHALLRTVALSAGSDALPKSISESAWASEFLNFESYHRLVETLYNLHREEPST